MHSVSAPAYSPSPSGYPNRSGNPAIGGADPLESAHRRIRQLAGQIAELARSDIPPEEFYPEFLKRVVEAVGACRGIIWKAQGEGEFRLLTEVRSAQAESPQDGGIEAGWEHQGWHQELLKRAAQTPLAAPPQPMDSPPPATESKNPTDWLLLLAPIMAEGEQAAVVELMLPRQASLAAPRQLRLLAQMGELAGRYFRRRRIAEIQKEAAFWRELEQFAQQVHARLDPAWTAYAFVNEGRRLLGCDRLSLLATEPKRCRVLAVSGSSEFDPRSPALRLLSRLTAAVLAGKEPLSYAGQSEALPPQVQSLVESYVDRTHTKALLILPLWPSEDLRSSSTPQDSPEGSDVGASASAVAPSAGWDDARPIGALVLEQFESAEIPESMRRRLEAIARHGQTALSHSLRYDGIFLRPVWEALGRQGWVVWARTLPRLAWIGAMGVLLLATLLLTPARLEMEASGTLEPVVRQDVFASIDGRVEKVLAAHGDRVEGPDPQTGRPGTLLCVLRNYELEEELARLAGERATLEERLAAISRTLLERQLAPVESDRLSAEQASVRQRLQSVDAQLAVCRRKQEQLSIYSPIDGQVITWDAAGLLLHRPVVRGDRLLRIAQTDGPWQVELHVPEDRIGHVLRAKRQTDEPLRVRFLLAADPTRSYEGRLVEIDSNAQDRPGEGRSVLAKVQIDRNQVSPLVPGSQVRARIDCGSCSLGYRWFHDLAAWLRRIWFWW